MKLAIFTLFIVVSSAFAAQLPAKTLGMYLLLADDTVAGYTSTDNWQPALNDYQVTGANVLFFTFIHPGTMKVPPAFVNFAKQRGTRANGAIPADTKIIFAIGGYSYSMSPNPWSWLTSPEAATAMAKEVATWPAKYGCDGIDLDIESGAGDAPNVGPNLITFIKVLKQTNPSMIVSQPVFGYPQVAAENYVVNYSWDVNGKKLGLADSIGLMVYEGTQALQYVKNYAQGTQQWQGFPITVNVATSDIILGAGGQASSSDILALASAVKSQNLGGIMVWYASVIDTKTGKPAFQYNGGSNDASAQAATSVWAQAIAMMKGDSKKSLRIKSKNLTRKTPSFTISKNGKSAST